MRQFMRVGIVLALVGLGTVTLRAEMMDKSKEMMGKDKSMMDGKMDGKMMDSPMTGMLKGAKDHHAAGTVAVNTNAAGRVVLALQNIKVDKVPDGRVYLANDGDHAKGVELGKLTQFAGNVEFPIPAGVDPHDYNGVVIWCKKFNVEIGRAAFETAMMDKEPMMDKKSMMEQKR